MRKRSNTRNGVALAKGEIPEAIAIGIDPSLASTGICVISRGGDVRATVLESPSVNKCLPIDRLAWFRRAFNDLFSLPAHANAVVCLEGYSYGSKFHAHQLGELGGVIRLAARDNATRLIVVPPKTLKQFVTGNGNAKKEMMIAEVFRTFNIMAKDNNEADAIGLAYMALVKAGLGFTGLTKARQAIVDKVV